MSGSLVFSEQDRLAADLLAWAGSVRGHFGPASLAVLGPGARERAKGFLAYQPAQVFVSEDRALDPHADSVIAHALAQIVERSGAGLVLLGATRRGRSIAPYLAGLLGAGCVTEAIELKVEAGELVTGRYSMGGNTVSQEVVTTPIKVVAVMPGALEPAGEREPAGEIVGLDLMLKPSRVELVERREKPKTAVDIAQSDRLVCVGRGLEHREDLAMIEGLAEALEAEMACTRPLSSELGWMTEERMIGISGQKCSPRLMLSVGVSGQVQHTVGIMGSKLIVAVNSDPNAPIFKHADYGIVGDLYELVPALTAMLQGKGAD
jgi:electron transfer flavoprotein alpha subunit